MTASSCPSALRRRTPTSCSAPCAVSTSAPLGTQLSVRGRSANSASLTASPAPPKAQSAYGMRATPKSRAHPNSSARAPASSGWRKGRASVVPPQLPHHHTPPPSPAAALRCAAAAMRMQRPGAFSRVGDALPCASGSPRAPRSPSPQQKTSPREERAREWRSPQASWTKRRAQPAERGTGGDRTSPSSRSARRLSPHAHRKRREPVAATPSRPSAPIAGRGNLT
eukprot:scaffold46236_cov26-Tisochrysis_lutea.AAC.4